MRTAQLRVLSRTPRSARTEEFTKNLSRQRSPRKHRVPQSFIRLMGLSRPKLMELKSALKMLSLYQALKLKSQRPPSLEQWLTGKTMNLPMLTLTHTSFLPIFSSNRGALSLTMRTGDTLARTMKWIRK